MTSFALYPCLFELNINLEPLYFEIHYDAYNVEITKKNEEN